MGKICGNEEKIAMVTNFPRVKDILAALNAIQACSHGLLHCKPGPEEATNSTGGVEHLCGGRKADGDGVFWTVKRRLCRELTVIFQFLKMVRLFSRACFDRTRVVVLN